VVLEEGSPLETELRETESPAESPESEDVETSCSEQLLSEERFGKPQESYSRVRRNGLTGWVLYDSPVFRHTGDCPCSDESLSAPSERTH